MESFPGSRNNSRAAERDWDNGSTASSIASMAEYTGKGTEFPATITFISDDNGQFQLIEVVVEEKISLPLAWQNKQQLHCFQIVINVL